MPTGCSSCDLQYTLDDFSNYPWNRRDWPAYGTIQDYDLSYLNVGIDSVMPAMLANVNEEEIYFEKWHVHETGDSMGRAFAEGRDEWQSYKCWILCSIPRSEYDMLVQEFRGQYDATLAESLRRESEDRARRVDWETRVQQEEIRRRTTRSAPATVYNYYDKTR